MEEEVIAETLEEVITETEKEVITKVEKLETRRSWAQTAMSAGKAIDVETNASWSDSRTAWDNWQCGSLTTIFDDVGIAKDGGLSGISRKDQLWHLSRIFRALLNLFLFVYNIVYILQTGLASLTDTKSTDTGGYLLTSAFIYTITGTESANFFSRQSESTVVTIELTILAGWLLYISYLLFVIIKQSGYKRWEAVSILCMDRIPQTGTYSAMKMLYFITPQVLSEHICYALFYCEHHVYLHLLAIIVTRPLMAIVGFDCFLIKYRAAEDSVVSGTLTPSRLMGTLIFLNQILGVVTLTWSTRRRLFRFVFGGKDGIMTPLELNRMKVWNVAVTKQIFNRFPLFKAITILLSWCDDDFQMLVLGKRDEQWRESVRELVRKRTSQLEGKRPESEPNEFTESGTDNPIEAMSCENDDDSDGTNKLPESVSYGLQWQE